MKKLVLSIFIFITINLSFGENQSSKCFLWEISFNNKTSFILGSIHLGHNDMYPLDERIINAFKKSDELIVENDITQINILELQQKILQYGMYSGNDILKNHISEDLYEKIKEKLNQNGMQIEAFHKFKPWFLGVTIQLLALTKRGYSQETGIDLYFINKAKGKKTIIGLENPDDQLNIFNNLSPKVSELFLESALMSLDETEETMKALVKAWKTGDTETLENLILKSFNEHPELKPIYNKLFTERNIKMTDKTINYLKNDKTYFIVVGAGHLIGKEGIVKLLQKKGIIIKQVE